MELTLPQWVSLGRYEYRYNDGEFTADVWQTSPKTWRWAVSRKSFSLGWGLCEATQADAEDR